MLRPYKLPENLFASDLHCHGLAFAFAALGAPRCKTFRKTFGRQAEACFPLAIGYGMCVVNVGGVGEVAHAELFEIHGPEVAAVAADPASEMAFLLSHDV